MKRLLRIQKARALLRKNFATMYPKGSTQSVQNFGKDWASATPNQRITRSGFGYRGEGDYDGDWKFSLFGDNFMAGNTVQTNTGYQGSGDYTTNQIMGGDMNMAKVSPSMGKTGDIVLAHSEFVSNVFATGNASNVSTFTQQAFPLNPGLPQVFPWLAQIASSFQLYDWEGLIFTYKPLQGEGGSNVLGKVVMACTYDPEASIPPGQAGPYSSSIHMETADYATCTKPAQGVAQGIETARGSSATNMLYVRNGATSRQKIFTDVGTFVVANEGVPVPSGTTIVIGEIWVSYKIRLSRALLFDSYLNNSVPFDNYRITTGTTLINGAQLRKSTNTIVDPTLPLGNLTAQQFPNGGFSSSNLLGFTFWFPVAINFGSYQVYIIWTQTIPTAKTMTVTVGNASLVEPGLLLSGGSAVNVVNAAAQNSTTSFYMTCAAPGAQQSNFTVLLSAADVAGSVFQIRIAGVPQTALNTTA